MGTTIILTLGDNFADAADHLEQWIKGVIALRERRAAQFGSDLFHDHAWDLILQLAIAPPHGLSKAELAVLLGYTEESTRRWLEILVNRGLANEGLDLRYQLSPSGLEALRATLP